VRLLAPASPAHAAPASSASTAAVTQTDLNQTTPVSGTVGFASPVTIDEPAGTQTSALTQAVQAVAQSQGNVTADQTSESDSQAADATSISQASASVTAAQSTLAADTSQEQTDESALAAAQQKQANDCQGTGAAASSAPSSNSSSQGGSSPCATDTSQVGSDQQKVASDQQKVSQDQAAVQNAEASLTTAQQHASQGEHQAQAKAAADQLALSNAEAALATARAAAANYGQSSKFTSVPTVGQVIEPGHALWSVDGQPTVLLTGAAPVWRAFASGMADGADVAELDQALIALGFGGGLTPSNTFTDATAAAINRLQASLHVPQTGTLPLGSVVFEPNGVRVTVVHATAGSTVQPGAPVIDTTSTTPIVNVALAVDQTYLVKVGDAVTVTLPDGSNSDGTITGVGSVATKNPDSGNGNNTPSATVNVTVSLSSTSSASALDQAPVTVNITNQSAKGVLAVPVAALLSLAGGGYAVEVVDANGSHHLVGVTTGLFDDQAGMVQVSGNGLAAGQKVVVAS